MSVDHCQREIHLLAGEVAQIQRIAQTRLKFKDGERETVIRDICQESVRGTTCRT